MKICFYHLDYKELFRVCSRILFDMKYHCTDMDSGFGQISGIKRTGQSDSTKLLDLKFRKDRNCIIIAVISNSMSDLSGLISSDPVSESVFAERLFRMLPFPSCPDNTFRIGHEDMIHAFGS